LVDIVSRAVRSRMMQGIRARNTAPEIITRKLLHRLGFRYTLNSNRLPGKPDIVLKKYGAVVFVHGCYWHQHQSCFYATMPSSNKAFWRQKFRDNVRRDALYERELLERGWRVFTIWECAVKKEPEKAIARLAKLLRVKACRLYHLPEFPPRTDHQ
jgi:DNA mismatch endonuclease, patch repair protein